MASFSTPAPPPAKRLKTKPASLADQKPPQFAKPSKVIAQRSPTTPSIEPPTSNSRYVESPEKATPAILPPSLTHLVKIYNLATMSIMNSSKIQQKVRTLLQHLSQFSFADLKAKPGVVALHARSEAANKLITVVEIVKREVEKEDGKWWQYSRISGEIRELKEEVHEERKGGISLDEGAGKDNGSTASNGQGTGDRAEVVVDKTNTEMEVDGKEEDEEDAFEPVPDKNGQARFENGKKRKRKIREMPVMTIYMSRVPLPEFRTVFGEQTNS